MDHVNTNLQLLNLQSTQVSECSQDELNDSIDLYMDCKINAIEVNIVKYLHGMGIQTKTDPSLKEQKYWDSRRIESNKKLEQFWSNTNLPLNASLTKLLKSKQSSTWHDFGQMRKSIINILDY